MSDCITKGLASRNAAKLLLDNILHDHCTLEAAIASSSIDLSKRDRSFVRYLVATVLRRLGQIDAIINSHLHQPIQKKNIWIENVLRLGVAQLLFLNTPAHAVVTCAVEQCNNVRPLKGLVNALLRKISNNGGGSLSCQDAARLNTPAWLWDAWSTAYGGQIARSIAEIHLKEPPLDLSTKFDPEKWAQELNARTLPWGSIRLDEPKGMINEMLGYAEGAWWVQDAAAALPANLLLSALEQQNVRILDLCAAPGGKTAQLASRGASVTALDNSPSRLARLKSNLSRLQLSADIVQADAALWRPDIQYPAVLLDAPCSATGTIRRHPDIQRLKRETDVTRLCNVQDTLLESALNALTPGGILVYSVCSLQPQECEPRVERLLSSHDSLRRLPISPKEVGGDSNLITELGDLRTLPSDISQIGGLDGFYAARLKFDGSLNP